MPAMMMPEGIALRICHDIRFHLREKALTALHFQCVQPLARLNLFEANHNS